MGSEESQQGQHSGHSQQQGGQSQGMDAFHRAYLNMVLARGGLQGAEACEAQVAHWILEGAANHDDLRHAREVTRKARKAFYFARARYNHLSSLAAQQAGSRAGAQAAQAAQAARLRESMRRAG